MRRYLAVLDKFGVSYKPHIKHNLDYKSFFGGIISVAIYILIIAYFGYKFNQYVTNGLIPSQTITLEYEENFSMVDNGDTIQFQILNTKINPFNITNQVLVPYMKKNMNNSEELIEYDSDYLYQENYINLTTQIYAPKNVSIAVGNGDYPTSFNFALRLCDPSTESNCADQSTIDAFFDQKLLVRSTIKTSQYNSFIKEITTMTRYNDFIIDKKTLFFQRVIMDTQLLNVDDGWLFQNSNLQRIYCDYSVQTQSTQDAVTTDLFVTELSMSSIVQKKSLQFTKLSTVLADVGSIYSLLMLISGIVQFINQFWMQEDIILDILRIYYPEFAYLNIKRILYCGPIRKVTFNQKTVNVEEFKKFYKKAKKIAESKLEVVNSIYEVSRLQFAVQQFLPKEILEKTHQQGIQLNFIQSDVVLDRPPAISDNQILKIEQQDSLLIFKDEDFGFLGLQNQILPRSKSHRQLSDLQQIL